MTGTDTPSATPSVVQQLWLLGSRIKGGSVSYDVRVMVGGQVHELTVDNYPPNTPEFDEALEKAAVALLPVAKPPERKPKASPATKSPARKSPAPKKAKAKAKPRPKPKAKKKPLPKPKTKGKAKRKR